MIDSSSSIMQSHRELFPRIEMPESAFVSIVDEELFIQYHKYPNTWTGLYPHHIDHYTKLTEVATTVQFVCHYWKLLNLKPN